MESVSLDLWKTGYLRTDGDSRKRRQILSVLYGISSWNCTGSDLGYCPCGKSWNSSGRRNGKEFHVDLWLAPGLNIQREPSVRREFCGIIPRSAAFRNHSSNHDKRNSAGTDLAAVLPLNAFCLQQSGR